MTRQQIAAERGYRDGRNDAAFDETRLRYYYDEHEFRAYRHGWSLGRKEYLKTLPPSQDMEATVGSEFV